MRKCKDGYYRTEVYFGVDPRTGKKRRRSITAKTKTECKRKAEEILREGEPVHEPQTTLKAFVTMWVKTYTLNYSKRYKESTESILRTHILPYFRDVELSKIDRLMVQEFVNSIDRSPKTVQNIHGLLHRILDVAVRLDYMRYNPATGTILPKREKPKLKSLSEFELMEFLESLPADRGV